MIHSLSVSLPVASGHIKMPRIQFHHQHISLSGVAGQALFLRKTLSAKRL